MTALLNQPGHVPQCKNHAEIKNRVETFKLDPLDGVMRKQVWETAWLPGCPHQRPLGNAEKWGWDCSGCRWGSQQKATAAV